MSMPNLLLDANSKFEPPKPFKRVIVNQGSHRVLLGFDCFGRASYRIQGDSYVYQFYYRGLHKVHRQRDEQGACWKR